MITIAAILVMVATANQSSANDLVGMTHNQHSTCDNLRAGECVISLSGKVYHPATAIDVDILLSETLASLGNAVFFQLVDIEDNQLIREEVHQADKRNVFVALFPGAALIR